MKRRQYMKGKNQTNVYCILLGKQIRFFSVFDVLNVFLKLINYQNITSNVIQATILMSKERNESIKNLKSGLFKNILESFAAVEGSKVHNSFKDGYLQYISAYCQKNA